MLIIVSKNIHAQALKKLKQLGTVFLFDTDDIVYHAISTHPDIFMAQVSRLLVISPVVSTFLTPVLKAYNIFFKEGASTPAMRYPQTIPYNICATQKFIFHNFKYTDEVIIDAADGLQQVNVAQGYTRCNLIALGEKGFLTSDKSIADALQQLNQKYFYINPKNILLHGFAEGFIGGACGYYRNTLFIHGNLKFLPENKHLQNFLDEIGVQYCELCDEPLTDIGSLFFLAKAD